MNDITKIKEENKFYIPNFSLVFEEYLDIFTVFHTKERVYFFLKKLLINARRFTDEYRYNDYPCPVQFNERNEYVLGIDYGFFLENLINFIMNEGGIIDENEQKKAKTLLRLLFGIDITNYKYNYPAQILMKNLFGLIYNITNYKNFDLKGRIFYPYFIENIEGNYFQLNFFFIKKSSLFKIFEDVKNYNFYFDFIKENSKKVVSKVPNGISPVELFSVKKF
jgi:hypothetical protein